MDKGVWEEVVRKNADKKIVGLRDKCEGGVCTTKRKSVPAVERGGKRICEGAVEEGIHPAIKVTANGTGIFCEEEGQEEKDGVRMV